MREDVVRKIKEEKVIAIVRGVERDKCMKTVQALYEGGIRLAEVTYAMNDAGSFAQTSETIRTLAREFDGKMLIGAGTVTSVELVDLSADAGASYIVAPDVNEAVIRRAAERGMASLPGAMTPTEIMQAHRAGADYVKVFPAGQLGADYIKAIRAPISHVQLVAVGGVDKENAAGFLRAGAVGLGVGGNLVNRAWIDAGKYEKLTAEAQALLAAIAVI